MSKLGSIGLLLFLSCASDFLCDFEDFVLLILLQYLLTP